MNKIVLAVVFVSFSAFAGEKCDEAREYFSKIEETVMKFSTSFKEEVPKDYMDYLLKELNGLKTAIANNDDFLCPINLITFQTVWQEIKKKYYGG